MPRTSARDDAGVPTREIPPRVQRDDQQIKGEPKEVTERGIEAKSEEPALSIGVSAQTQPLVRDFYNYAPTDKFSEKGMSAMTDPFKVEKESIGLSAMSFKDQPVYVDRGVHPRTETEHSFRDMME